MVDDIDFKPVDINDIHKRVDSEIDKIREDIETLSTIRQIEEKPPESGTMSVDIKPGVYAVDLRRYIKGQLADCPGTVIPVLVDHTVRTSLDLKNAFRTEKRVVDFQYWWVFFAVIGVIAIIAFTKMLGFW